MRRIPLEGKTFGSWTVGEYLGNKKYSCTCRCGKVKPVYNGHLVGGASTQCRSCSNVGSDHGRWKGGVSDHPAYFAWQGMCSRVDNNYYGGYEEICVDPTWRDSAVFLKYVDEHLDFQPGKVLHRIDNEGDYEPGNVEFLTKSEHTTLHNLTTKEYNSAPQ